MFRQKSADPLSLSTDKRNLGINAFLLIHTATDPGVLVVKVSGVTFVTSTWSFVEASVIRAVVGTSYSIKYFSMN